MPFAGRRVHAFRRCVPSHLSPVATAKRSELRCQRYRSFAASMGLLAGRRVHGQRYRASMLRRSLQALQ